MNAARIIWSELVSDALLLELQSAAGDIGTLADERLRAPIVAILAATGGLPGVAAPWDGPDTDAIVRRYLAEGLLHVQSRLEAGSRFGRYSVQPPQSAPFEHVLEYRVPLNINTASVPELDALPVIGPTIAARIVAERHRGGPFADADDLAARVTGLGPDGVHALQGEIVFRHPLSSLKLVERSWSLTLMLNSWVMHVPGDSPRDRLFNLLDRVATSCAERPHPATTEYLPRNHPDSFAGQVHATQWVGVLWSGEYYVELPALMASASQSIRVALFHAAFPDDNHPTRVLLDALVEAHERGVEVRVLLDADRPSDPYRSTIINAAAIEYLVSRGISVKTDAPDTLLHSKFVLIDDHTIVAGSHNWSAGSYFVFDDVSLVLRSTTLASEWRAEFDALWT